MSVLFKIVQNVKQVFDCPKSWSIVHITSCNSEAKWNLSHSDGELVTIDRTKTMCTCRGVKRKGKGNDRNINCKHIANIDRILRIHSDSNATKLYARLSCVMIDPNCLICLDRCCSYQKEDLSDLEMSKMYVCDNCGKAMHRKCGKKWEMSVWGNGWNKRCFICRRTLTET